MGGIEYIPQETILIPDQNIPLTPFDSGLSLFPRFGEQAWALLNLILAVLGSIVAIALAARTITQKRRDRKQPVTEDYPEAQKRHRLTWLIVALGMGFAGVILFLITQDLTLPMVLIDWWTIAQAVIFGVQIVAVMLVFKRAVVTFETNSEDKNFSRKVKFGRKIRQPDSPQKPGYLFAGWYEDEMLTHPRDFDRRVDRNIKLYAKWNKV